MHLTLQLEHMFKLLHIHQVYLREKERERVQGNQRLMINTCLELLSNSPARARHVTFFGCHHSLALVISLACI